MSNNSKSSIYLFLIISISEEKFLMRKAKGYKSPQDADNVIACQFLP